MVGEVMPRLNQQLRARGDRIGGVPLRERNSQVPGLPGHDDFEGGRLRLGAESGLEERVGKPACDHDHDKGDGCYDSNQDPGAVRHHAQYTIFRYGTQECIGYETVFD